MTVSDLKPKLPRYADDVSLSPLRKFKLDKPPCCESYTLLEGQSPIPIKSSIHLEILPNAAVGILFSPTVRFPPRLYNHRKDTISFGL